MTDKPSIFAALAAVMDDVKHVGKDGWNDHQKFNFRGIDAVVNAVGPALRAHGVIVVPVLVSVTYETVQTTQNKAQTACRVVVSYRFWGPSGDSIETTVAGEAWDSGDKATPKAMSVAFRTALLQSLALPTDEPDPDASTFERADDTQYPPPPPDPVMVVRGRIKDAWEAGHGGAFDRDAMFDDLTAQMGVPENVEPTLDQLNIYADLLEGKS